MHSVPARIVCNAIRYVIIYCKLCLIIYIIITEYTTNGSDNLYADRDSMKKKLSLHKANNGTGSIFLYEKKENRVVGGPKFNRNVKFDFMEYKYNK